jgi:hypothetical protein
MAGWCARTTQVTGAKRLRPLIRSAAPHRTHSVQIYGVPSRWRALGSEVRRADCRRRADEGRFPDQRPSPRAETDAERSKDLDRNKSADDDFDH